MRVRPNAYALGRAVNTDDDFQDATLSNFASAYQGGNVHVIVHYINISKILHIDKNKNDFVKRCKCHYKREGIRRQILWV